MFFKKLWFHSLSLSYSPFLSRFGRRSVSAAMCVDEHSPCSCILINGVVHFWCAYKWQNYDLAEAHFQCTLIDDRDHATIVVHVYFGQVNWPRKTSLKNIRATFGDYNNLYRKFLVIYLISLKKMKKNNKNYSSDDDGRRRQKQNQRTRPAQKNNKRDRKSYLCAIKCIKGKLMQRVSN